MQVLWRVTGIQANTTVDVSVVRSRKSKCFVGGAEVLVPTDKGKQKC